MPYYFYGFTSVRLFLIRFKQTYMFFFEVYEYSWNK